MGVINGGRQQTVVSRRIAFLLQLSILIVLFLSLPAIVLSKSKSNSNSNSVVGEEAKQVPVRQPWMQQALNNFKEKVSVNIFGSFLFPPIGRPLASKAGEGLVGKERVDSTGDKVKEAMEKSVGKAKQTIEDSAKSAADKLKKTLSSSSDTAHHPQEL